LIIISQTILLDNYITNYIKNLVKFITNNITIFCATWTKIFFIFLYNYFLQKLRLI